MIPIRRALLSVSDKTGLVDFGKLLAEHNVALVSTGATTPPTRGQLAARAYARTAAYDAAISTWFADQLSEPFPRWLSFAGRLQQTLRYGENPHQTAALYVTGEKRPGVAAAVQIQGK